MITNNRLHLFHNWSIWNAFTLTTTNHSNVIVAIETREFKYCKICNRVKVRKVIDGALPQSFYKK